MELFDVILCEREVFPRGEDQVHSLGVAGDLLLVAGLEGVALEVREQRLDLAVGESDALDSGRGADGFDGGDVAQCPEPFGRKSGERLPAPLELVELADEAQGFVGGFRVQGDGFEGVHTRKYTRIYPNEASKIWLQFSSCLVTMKMRNRNYYPLDWQ